MSSSSSAYYPAPLFGVTPLLNKRTWSVALSPFSPLSNPLSPDGEYCTTGNYLPPAEPALPVTMIQAADPPPPPKRKHRRHKVHAISDTHFRRDPKPVYSTGNFDPYYAQRFERVAEIDPRLSAVVESAGVDFFLKKKILDIGCNCGFYAFYIAAYLGAASVVGIDIDSHLILSNLRQLRKFKHDGIELDPRPNSKRDHYPSVLVKRSGPVSLCNKPWRVSYTSSARSSFPFNVEFRCADYSEPVLNPSPADIVICWRTAKYVSVRVEVLVANILAHLGPAGGLVLGDATLLPAMLASSFEIERRVGGVIFFRCGGTRIS